MVTDLLIIKDGPLPVVIATERADNPGASITNTIEKLAAALSSETGWLLGDCVLVEHYPARGGEHPRSIDHLPRSLDQVSFERMWSGVSWNHIGVEGLKALIAPVAAEEPDDVDRMDGLDDGSMGNIDADHATTSDAQVVP